MVFSAVIFNKNFETTFNENGTTRQQIFTGFTVNQNVNIQSKEVNKIEEISRQCSELINSGVEFYSSLPEQQYTKLAELKIQMIAKATKDASAIAKSITENMDANLGSLKKMRCGCFSNYRSKLL